MNEQTFFDADYAILDELDRKYAEPVDNPEAETTALITVTALPELKENLRALRASWEQKAADAAAMICTEETVQTLKAYRAEMRKEFDEADAQRKAAKTAYMSPWNEVEATYKECVSEAFKKADGALKGKIGEFEDEIKAKCRADLEAYYAEMVAAEPSVAWLTFDRAMGLGGIKISMADANAKTPRKLRDALWSVVARVATDLEHIDSLEDAPEIAEEYKRQLDATAAIATVAARKKRVECEREATEARRAAQERRDEAVAKVEAAAPPEAVSAPTMRDERLFKITFTVTVTRDQGLKLKKYLIEEGIQYE